MIQIDDYNRVSSYLFGWQIESRHKNKKGGWSRWEGESFYATPQQAVKGLLMRDLQTSEVQGLADCIAACRKRCDEIVDAFTEEIFTS